MYPLLVAIAITAAAITGSVVSTFKKDNKVKENITKSEELQTVQKLSVVSESKIKLSNLIQKTDLSLKQKEDLDNFQKAIDKAVIEENINNPTCDDLVATGYISQTKCEIIKNGSNNYATVKKGQLSLSDPKMIQIINAKDAFKNSTTSNGITQIQSYNKVFLQKRKNIVNKIAKRERKEANIVATTTDLEQIKKYADNIKNSIDINTTDTINDSHEIINRKIRDLNKIANLARRKQQIQRNTTTGVNIPKYKNYATTNTTSDRSTNTTTGVINDDVNEIKTISQNIMNKWF